MPRTQSPPEQSASRHAATPAKSPHHSASATKLADNRPRAAAQRALNEAAQTSPAVAQRRSLQDAAASSPVVMRQRAFAEMAAKSPRVLQQKAFADAVQRAQTGATASPGSSEPVAQLEPKPNRTGLPDQLKDGIESLAGMPLNVKVHYNSPKPAQVNALAYAQGSDIHVGPGQEKHLPHEAWHVVQQAQGRVRPTMQTNSGVPVNDDNGLEREADVMGIQALRQGSPLQHRGSVSAFASSIEAPARASSQFDPVQREDSDDEKEQEPIDRLKDFLNSELSDFFETSGNFIWMKEGERQSLHLSHLHIFAISRAGIKGQITVRNTPSQAGGVAFNTSEDNDGLKDGVQAEILAKVGNDAASADARKEILEHLMSLWDEFLPLAQQFVEYLD